MEGQGARKEVVMQKEEVTNKILIYKTTFKTHNLEHMTNFSFVHFKFVSSLKNLSTFSLKLSKHMGLSTFWLKTLPTFSFYNHLFVSTCLLHLHLSQSSITHIFDHALLLALHKTQDHTQVISVLFFPLMKACRAFQ
jgi:hypothetical protein